MLIRDEGGEGGGGAGDWRLDRAPTRKTEETVDRRQNNGSIKAVSPRHCEQLLYYAVTVSTAVLGRVRRTMSVAPLFTTTWSKKEVQLSEPSSTSLLTISSGLTWGSSTTSLLLIPPGLANESNFFLRDSSPPFSWSRLDPKKVSNFLRVQLTCLLLISPGL